MKNQRKATNRMQQTAISAALPLLQADREILLNCHSRVSKKTRKRIIDRAVKTLIAKYDEAIEMCSQALHPKSRR